MLPKAVNRILSLSAGSRSRDPHWQCGPTLRLWKTLRRRASDSHIPKETTLTPGEMCFHAHPGSHEILIFLQCILLSCNQSLSSWNYHYSNPYFGKAYGLRVGSSCSKIGKVVRHKEIPPQKYILLLGTSHEDFLGTSPATECLLVALILRKVPPISQFDIQQKPRSSAPGIYFPGLGFLRHTKESSFPYLLQISRYWSCSTTKRHAKFMLKTNGKDRRWRPGPTTGKVVQNVPTPDPKPKIMSRGNHRKHKGWQTRRLNSQNRERYWVLGVRDALAKPKKYEEKNTDPCRE